MNRALRLPGIAVFAIALFVVNTAHATTVQKLSLRDLVKKSSSIVVAKVESAESRIDPTNKEIYTYVTLRLQESVKGMKSEPPAKGAKSENTLTIRQIGGQVGSIASVVPGMPSFRPNEEVVLFLTDRDGAGYPWVMGLQQGKYTIVTDANGHRSVRNELDGLRMLSPDGTLQEGAHVAKDMPLEAFLDGVRGDLDDAGKVQIAPLNPNE